MTSDAVVTLGPRPGELYAQRPGLSLPNTATVRENLQCIRRAWGSSGIYSSMVRAQEITGTLGSDCAERRKKGVEADSYWCPFARSRSGA